MRLGATGVLVACATLAPAGCVMNDERRFRIPAASMEPTLHCAKPNPGCRAAEEDKVVTAEVEADEIQRGDIVVFDLSASAAERCGLAVGATFVSRVIGLPGEAVEVGGGRVTVDGEALDEPYAEGETTEPPLGPQTSGRSDGFFVMGDNREMACDSRVFGPIGEESIVGRVVTIERDGDEVEVE